MTEALADLGLAVGSRLLAPLACWSVLAALAEGLFHAAPRVPADVRLPVRRALLLSLPLALALPFAADALVPSLESEAVRGALAPFALPEIAVGAPTDPTAPTVSGGVVAGVLVALAGGAALLSGVRLAVALARLRRCRRALGPADEETVALATALAADAGLARCPVLALGPPDASPYTVGARRPVVVLPRGLDADARRLALAHELAHVRRHDFAWTVAERAARAVGAAHPLAHVLAAGAAVDRECLADAEVLRAAPALRRAYADLLLRLADRPAPALAVGAAASSPLKHRLIAMHHPLSPRALRRARAAGRALALSLVAVPLLVGAAGAPAETFRIADATVTLDGVETTFRGSVTTDAFGAFGLDVPGAGRVLVSPEPFAGASRVGQVDGDRLVASASGHSLTIVSEAPILASGARMDLYSRFELDGSAHLAPGFELAMGVSRTAAGLERLFDTPASPPPPPAARPSPPRVGAAPDTTLPELIGGMQALGEAVVYPQLQKMAGIEGRAVVGFVVGPDGAVRDVDVRTSSGDAALDAAAVAAVQAVRFRPGMVDGQPVAVELVVPISFALPADDE